MSHRKLVVSANVEKYLDGLDNSLQERIITKLKYYASLPNPMIYANRLMNSPHGSYRYRIWDYRAIVDFDEEGRMIIVVLIGHRKDIYK